MNSDQVLLRMILDLYTDKLQLQSLVEQLKAKVQELEQKEGDEK